MDPEKRFQQLKQRQLRARRVNHIIETHPDLSAELEQVMKKFKELRRRAELFLPEELKPRTLW